MRISDWSSDVCSSDLEQAARFGVAPWLGEHIQRQSGALSEQHGRYAVGEAQHIHQEFEGQFIRCQQLFACAEGLGRIEVVLRQAGLPAAQDASVGVGEFGMRSEEHTSELQSLMRI